MKKVLRILMIEDVLADVVLLNSELRKGGFQFRSKRVETKESFLDELKNDPPDLILADHGLPSFDSFTALTIAQKECPHVPFIFVTGNVGEETAAETLKSGASDIVLKNHLSNLVPAVHRALRQSDERAKSAELGFALKESEQKFRMLLEGVKDFAIFMLDPQGKITSWNAGAEWMENYRADEILNRPISCLYIDEDAAANKPDLALKIAVAEGRFEEDGWRLRKSGTRFWANTVVTPLRGDDRHLRGFAVVMRDLTHRFQNDETWRRYEAIINTAKDCFTLIDSNCRYIAANDAYCRAQGKTREEIVGKTVSEIWGKEIFEHLIAEPLRRCLAGEEIHYQSWFSFPKLGRRYFDVSYYPYSRQGDIPGAIVVTHDVSEFQHAQQDAQKMNGNLERPVGARTEELNVAYQEMQALCYSISHDLRAPIRHIDGFVELLQQEVSHHLNAESRTYLKTISESAKLMGRLIDSLLAFSQIGRQEFRPVRIALAALILEIRREFEPQCEGRNIEWVMADLPTVQADPAQLRQALVELISNAIKFTKPKAQARIEAGGTSGAKENVVFIRDNGVGFDPEYKHKLFGVFQKLHSPQQFEGTGIGLAKVRRIIQRHGGRTWAEGQIDRGATFYFSLPIPAKEASEGLQPEIIVRTESEDNGTETKRAA